MLRHDFTATTKVKITSKSSVPSIQGVMVSVKTTDKLFPNPLSRSQAEL
jgi:hypothetical protein